MKTEIVYICDYCDKKYTTNKEVLECENSCKANIKEFEVIKFEFYHKLGKIKKFDSLEDRRNFLKDKLSLLTCKMLTTRSLTKDMACVRKEMLKVCISLEYKISRLKATIKDRRLY